MGLQNEEKKLAAGVLYGYEQEARARRGAAADPELLFLDEPYEGVDAVASRVLRDTLMRAVERGATSS